MNPPRRAVTIALGSNLGDRAGALRAALHLLDEQPRIRVRAASAFHETAAVTLPGDDAQQPAYLNACALVQTTLPAPSFLEVLLGVERALGRVRARGARWAPRIIDLDLLLDGDTIIDLPGLVVPHPRMHERRFVLAPLAEIAPDAIHPVLGKTIRALLDDLDSASGARPATVISTVVPD